MARRRVEATWVERIVLDAVHLDQLREHGGMPGIRDENALESALARPQHRWHYRRASDLATLAAAYGWGLATSHSYRDGNKRIGFLAMAVFAELNGWRLEAPEEEVVQVMLAVADHRLTEGCALLGAWLRSRLLPYGLHGARQRHRQKLCRPHGRLTRSRLGPYWLHGVLRGIRPPS